MQNLLAIPLIILEKSIGDTGDSNTFVVISTTLLNRTYISYGFSSRIHENSQTDVLEFRTFPRLHSKARAG
jgi:hypothetical protein